jgi:hypothetical protein
MASGDFDLAASSLEASGFTAETLRERVETFFGGEPRLTVVIPNDRLVGVINDAAKIQLPSEGKAWMMAQIPLTHEPNRAKEDDVMLMGAAVSFFVVESREGLRFEFEIFHA